MPDPRSRPFAADFHVHALRTHSEAEARADFGEMIAQLVDALYPQAREPDARSRCNGLGHRRRDAICGHLDGRLVVWQTRYVLPRLGAAHVPPIHASYLHARVHAREHGSRLGRWVLCVPGQLDPRLRPWWERWRREQRVATGTDIDLWDDHALRARLGRPVAKLVRAGYYCRPGAAQFGWSQPADGLGEWRDASVAERSSTVGADIGGADIGGAGVAGGGVGGRWCGGAMVRMAGRACVLDGDPVERYGGDGSWLLREGAASLVGPVPRPVWFRQVLVRRPDDRADALLAAIDGQLRLLTEIGDLPGLPTLVAGQVTPAEGVLLSDRPAGRTWRDLFGPAVPGRAVSDGDRARVRPPAPVVMSARPFPGSGRGPVIALLQAAAGVGDALAALHESGHSHRATTPDSVLLPALAGHPRSASPTDTPTAGPCTDGTFTDSTVRDSTFPGRGLADSVVAGPSRLRDLGLATVARQAGEGPVEYRAPEQDLLGLHGPRVGLRTDIFRLAAMVYHGLAGVTPARAGPAPLRGLRLPFPVPDTLDEVLLRALDLDPARRPARIRVLADAFRLSAQHLARAGRQGLYPIWEAGPV